jgi:hypothetical protein
MSHRRRRVVPFIRERYVQAKYVCVWCDASSLTAYSFRFAVAPGGTDYSFFIADPDQLVDWHLVELVYVHSQDPVACPICLCDPTAAYVLLGHRFSPTHARSLSLGLLVCVPASARVVRYSVASSLCLRLSFSLSALR